MLPPWKLCIYMEEGSLFCFVSTYEIHRIGMLQIVFLVSLEGSQGGEGGGVHGLGSMTFGRVLL